MKKSELYKRTQMCVVNSLHLPVLDKLEILRELMRREDTELFCEEQEAKKEKANEAV